MIRKPSVSMDFKKLTIDEEVIFGQNVHDQMLANVAIFAIPDVPLATLQTKNDNLQTTSIEARSGDHSKVAAMYLADREWDTTFGTEAAYVDRIANGNESLILKSGFQATKSETSPAVIPPAPVVSILKVNPLPGSIHVEVDYQQGTKNFLYVVATTDTPIKFKNNEFSLSGNLSVVGFISDKHRKVDFNNLPQSTTLFLSVLGQNSAGTGTPSVTNTIKTL